MPKENDFYRIHNIEHIIRLFQAGQLQKIQDYIQQLSPSKQALVIPWWKQYNNIDYDKALNIPKAVQMRIQGWKAYFNYNYLDAHQYFKESIQYENWQEYAYESALGLTKVYTRSGHWNSAKMWCLYYLYLARQHHDHFSLTKGYGALAEIFLRANEAQAALACFQMSHQLMPRGQGQNEKQMNYIASALVRNQEFLRAEGLLYSSIKTCLDNRLTSLDKSDLSIYHSISRLSFKWIAKDGYFNVSQLKSYINHIQLEQVPKGIKAIPYGFIQVAIAIGHIQSNNKETALLHLDQAQKAFDAKAPMEIAWVKQLIYVVQGKPISTPNVTQQHLLNISPITAPNIQAVMDLTWHKYSLSDQGFAGLFDSKKTMQDVIQQWKLFFI